MKIGNLQLNGNLFLAPMAGITDVPFRSLAREYGCSLCFTEMISANGLIRYAEKTLQYLKKADNECPFAVQVFGSDPEVIASAARIAVEEGAQLIDINMGCPAKKILRTGAGAALLREPGKVGAIVKRVRAAVDVPLTIKIRSGWKHDINAVRIALIAEEQGADAIVVHPRTVEQGFSGRADWSMIKAVKQAVRFPVIGNGDIVVATDAFAMMTDTGCDGVMVGRGTLGNPWIFNQIREFFGFGVLPELPILDDRRVAAMRHFEKMRHYYGERGLSRCRIKLPWYVRGLSGAVGFRKKIIACETQEALLDALCAFFESAEHDLK